MNLNDLANLGQVIGAIAVVVSLFYLANQIRQNTNAVRSAAAQVVHDISRAGITCSPPMPSSLRSS